MVGPVFRRQLCREHLSTPADKGNKLTHTQSFAQTPCPGRAGMEEPKAEEREARPPPMRRPVGCWGSAPNATQKESVQLHPSLHTKPFCSPLPGLPSPRQMQHCLAKGQLIFWAAGGGEEDNGSSGDPATLKCHQAVCGRAWAGQRGLLLPASEEGDLAV